MTTCYKRLSFSNDEEFKLIEFIKNHPALWDSSHEEYGNAELRKSYWMSLAKELNKTEFECRRKWRFVRDYYIHKRPRQPESTPQRDGKYYSLQFLNKVKVSSKKCAQNLRIRKNISKNLEVNFLNSDEELDYDYLDDPIFEKMTVERIGGDQKYTTNSSNNSCLRQHDQDDTNDDKSEAFLQIKEDYIDEESSVADDFGKLQNIEEEEEHLLMEGENDLTNYEEEATKAESTSLLHEKAIDLFFESMAAAVKTFPPQYVAEVKCKVFMAFNEVEAKVYKNVNKSN